ncbi:unnamed protein product [Parascedosporium putredinis]|uniref:non-specific serine/threonine protein kinase n=1 Tax=Parascedosporium putredinis TaxID=1442378 RepID=A0A9P1M5N5_9PEZI|nr:unnamed protein product [Parascedosporium putredinis]CAI7988254.1 unnamed protein product [Parascedosporium putredinis]
MSTTTSSEYDVLEKIGHGSFGIIRRVRRKSDGLILCRKEINYGKMSQKEREQLHAEFQCLSSLRHPNIVAYYHREHLKSQQELHLYMEYCGSGDLGRVIKDLTNKGQRATESFVWSTFSQLVAALYRCHYGIDPAEIGTDILGIASGAQNQKAPEGGVVIMHRDLKPENVFLGKDNSVKLGDFGLSKMIKSHDFASTYVGTPYYMSPEICAAERYTLKSDIWSLGCIIYELCAREPPSTPKCLRVNPDERPSTFDLLQLPIMRLMRKEKEVSDMGKSLKMREAAFLAKEAELAQQISALESTRAMMREEINTNLHREWEVKARLEISKQINMEVEKLHRQFDAEVQVQVEMELKQRLALRDTDTAQADAILALKGAQPPRPRHHVRRPRRNSGDVEMSEPSPMAISSLSLSPRRNAAMKPPTVGSANIFKVGTQQANADLLWNVPRDSKTPDSDDEDFLPSPTRNIRSNKNPFMAKNRPTLASKISNKPLPMIPSMQMSPEGPKGGLLDRPTSPNRRLSKIPSATNLGHRAAADMTGQLGRKPSLQQARAGGRPLSAVIAPGGENVSPKKASASKDRGVPARRASDTVSGCVAVWDPERDEMPSPFLVRTKQQRVRI